MEIASLQSQLEAAFAAQGVRVAYLFGSQATGRARPDSDVDIAVLWGDDVPRSDYFRRRLELIGAMMDLFRTNDVDVVVLNEATPLLAVEVLRHGRLLYNVDDRLRVEFQVRTVQVYRDTAFLRRLLAEELEYRVRAGKFGQPEPFVPLTEEERGEGRGKRGGRN
jgi:predicted nucleotidyltransferase